jgi:ABC-type enterobactin transport system permease subunit
MVFDSSIARLRNPAALAAILRGSAMGMSGGVLMKTRELGGLPIACGPM